MLNTFPVRRSSFFERASAASLDAVMCAMMYALQQRHRLAEGSREVLHAYIERCETVDRPEYFSAPELVPVEAESRSSLVWRSPVATEFPENDRVRADLYPCDKGWTAPTVLFLHALMSASDVGYRRWAALFNAQGWNACLIHLPFHYSRTPTGRMNGELAITPDLVRTAEALRQGVSEIRQLMAKLRSWGVPRFGLWATSYGAWIGALLASVEADFRFIALMTPIADVEHAIWTSPAGAALRNQLDRRSIDRALVRRHFRLASPIHGRPLCDPKDIILVAGLHDRVTPPSAVDQLHRAWSGSQLLVLPQGHFGYLIQNELWKVLQAERSLI